MKIVRVPPSQNATFSINSATCIPRSRIFSSGKGPGDSADRDCDGLNVNDMSPEARQVFKEAQENILALNSSRVRALHELKVANEKIVELERMLEDAVTQIMHLRENRDVSRQELDAGLPLASSTDGGRPEGGREIITVAYNTGWETAYIHYQVDTQAWTQLPGAPMQDGQGALSGKKVFHVVGNRLEFVLTNGSGKFDTPNPYGEPGRPSNYVVASPGTWLLQAGELHQLDINEQ